jgi:hypothetical protein
MRPLSTDSGQKAIDESEPSAESLAEMPEIDDTRFRRRPGRGHHSARSVGEIVGIDTDLWPHFGSQKAVNDACGSSSKNARGAFPRRLPSFHVTSARDEQSGSPRNSYVMRDRLRLGEIRLRICPPD